MTPSFFPYFRHKLLGSFWSVVLLTLPPGLWALLAFNDVVKVSSPGFDRTLAANSLSICLYRFLGATALSLVFCLILLALSFTRLHWKALFAALVGHLKNNWGTVVGAAVFTAIALEAFFLSFEWVGIVITNVVSVGFLPFVSIAIDALKRRPQRLSGYDWVALLLVVCMLVSFLLLAFDTINYHTWQRKIAQHASDCNFNLGILASFINAVVWKLYLDFTSRWPTSEDEATSPEGSLRHATFTSRYRQLAGIPPLQPAPDTILGLLETAIVRVAAVQLLSFIIAGISCWLLAAIIHGPRGPFTLFSDTWNDLHYLGSVAHRLFSFAALNLTDKPAFVLWLIILLPSFGAYLLLNTATSAYREKQQASGLAVSAGQWNDLFAFVEPAGATVLIVLVIPSVSSAWNLGLAEERTIFVYPNLLVAAVLSIYTGAFFVKLLGIYRETLKRDVGAYFRLLQKIADDVLKKEPAFDLSRLDSPTQNPVGLKQQDLAELRRCADRDGDRSGTLLRKAFDYEQNHRQQALIFLSFVAQWPFACRFRVVDAKTRGRLVSVARIESPPKPEDTDSQGSLSSAVYDILRVNFPPLPPPAGFPGIDVFLLHFPAYAAQLPVHAYEWREVEKSLYFSLTGSLWHKLQRHRAITLEQTIRSTEGADLVAGITRGFIVFNRDRIAAAQSGCTPNSISWQTLSFFLAPQILDCDHMTRGLPKQLFNHDIPGTNLSRIQPGDKLLLLTIPSAITFPGLGFRNPLLAANDPLAILAPDGEAINTAAFAASICARLVERLNDIGGAEAKRRFHTELLTSPFILYHKTQ